MEETVKTQLQILVLTNALAILTMKVRQSVLGIKASKDSFFFKKNL